MSLLSHVLLQKCYACIVATEMKMLLISCWGKNFGRYVCRLPLEKQLLMMLVLHCILKYQTTFLKWFAVLRGFNNFLLKISRFVYCRDLLGCGLINSTWEPWENLKTRTLFWVFDRRFPYTHPWCYVRPLVVSTLLCLICTGGYSEISFLSDNSLWLNIISYCYLVLLSCIF